MVAAWTGLSVLDPVFSSVLWRFFPVLAILAGVIILKERITKYELSAMFIMLIGSLWSIAGRWQIVGTGVILTLLAGCAGAVQLLIAKSKTDLIHANVLVAYRVGIGAMFIALWVFASNKADFAVEARYWHVTLLGAFLGPCASFLLTFRSYRYWTLAQSSIVLTLQPLLVLPLTYVFLGTLPSPKELTGGLVILSGALWLTIVQITKKKESSPSI
jgi:drug/metabolite transporter (DMT)-like permease